MRKLLPYFLVATFILVALFGLLMPLMHTGDNCPFAGGCVAALEYLEHWQTAFAAVLTPSFASTLLLFLAVFFFSRFYQQLCLLYPSPQRIRISRKQEVVAHDPLRRFIAQGLMHPKPF
jgi:hypothetical protein